MQVQPRITAKRTQGQYHYTYIVAPESTRRFAAYMIGFWNIIAWWANAASGTIYVAISTFGIVEMWYPGVAGAQWQVYLCYLLCLVTTCKSSQRHHADG